MTRRGQVLVAGVSLFVVYNLNLRAIESRDTRTIEHVALSIAARVDADLNEFPALYPAEHLADPSGATIRVDGHVRATYPVVTSLAAVPFFWGAIRFGLLDPERPHSIQIEAVGKLAASVWTSLACIALGLLIGKMADDCACRPVHAGRRICNAAVVVGIPGILEPCSGRVLSRSRANVDHR